MAAAAVASPVQHTFDGPDMQQAAWWKKVLKSSLRQNGKSSARDLSDSDSPRSTSSSKHSFAADTDSDFSPRSTSSSKKSFSAYSDSEEPKKSLRSSWRKAFSSGRKSTSADSDSEDVEKSRRSSGKQREQLWVRDGDLDLPPAQQVLAISQMEPSVYAFGCGLPEGPFVC